MLDEEHLVDQAVKLAGTIFLNTQTDSTRAKLFTCHLVVIILLFIFSSSFHLRELYP